MMRILTCEMCGTDFETDKKYIKYCGDACAKEAQRRKAVERRAVAKTIKAVKNTIKRETTLTEIAVAAREAGMSYGQYVGMVHGK